MAFIKKVDNQVQQLASAQAATASWADLNTQQDGPWINVFDCLAISLWLKIVINSSLNLRFRMLCKQSDAATDVYQFPIEAPSALVVDVSPEYKELTDDATQNIILPFAVSDNFPFVKFQVEAGTAGSVVATGNITITSFANLVSGTDDSVTINGIVFTAQVGAAVLGAGTFQAATDDDTTAESLKVQINAHASLSSLVLASRVGAVVTITALTAGTAGNAITLVYTDNDTNVGATRSGATLTGGVDSAAITAGVSFTAP